MYYQLKTNIIFRNYRNFGYITDNRNYSYKKLLESNSVIGDKIVSETGAIFLSVLSTHPKKISELVSQIMKYIQPIEYEVIKNDAIEFYNLLEKDGFLVSGMTAKECYQNNINSVKIILDKGNKKTIFNKQQDTLDFLKRYFSSKPLLRSVHIDITSLCNERCIHCFIPHEFKNHHMDLELFNKIVKESVEMKVLNFTISGGEPMLHPNFLEIVNRCKKENISLNILSNLTLLSDEIINEIKTNPLISVQASLYSIDPNVHDDITKVKGSCNLTKDAIKRLVDNNVNLQISCPILKQNVHCYKDVIEWGKTMNLNVSSDYNLVGMYNSNTQNLECRLKYEDVSNILCDLINTNRNDFEQEVTEKKALTMNDDICSVCRYSFCISELGKVYPCAGWQSFVLGNIQQSTLHSLWNKSKKINYLRNLKIKDFEICANCDDRLYCSICMARNANENKSHNPMIVSKYHCEIAQLKKTILLKRHFK